MLTAQQIDAHLLWVFERVLQVALNFLDIGDTARIERAVVSLVGASNVGRAFGCF